MPPTKTLTVGLGTKGATISGQVITWPRRRRQDHTTGFVLNIDLLVNRAITAVTKDSDGFILTTTVSGDISAWVPATEGLTTTINDTTVDVHVDTNTASLALASDDTEVIMTPVKAGASREEVYGGSFKVGMNFDGIVYETDEVGTRQMFRHTTENSSTFFFGGADTDNCLIRDAWLFTGDQNAFQWGTNAIVGAVVTIERCIFNISIAQKGGIRIRTTGLAKLVNINNCIFAAGGNITSSDFGMIQTEGTQAHVINVNHCLFWGCGQIHDAKDAAHTVNYTNCVFFRVHDYEVGSAATRTYTNCKGADPVVGGRPTGVALTDEISAFLAIHKSPGGAASNLFLRDLRPVSDPDSSLFEAGTPVSGVAEDMDGRPRSLSTPDIGPTEGFPALTLTPGGILIP